MSACLRALKVVGDTIRALRTALRSEAYERWCKLQTTIRYESNDINQDELITKEKREYKYEKYADRYRDSFGDRYWCVKGLWFGSVGSIGKSVIDFFKVFNLDCDKLKDISETVLVKTIIIINNHIYN